MENENNLNRKNKRNKVYLFLFDGLTYIFLFHIGENY